jgi:hypothetical protein
LSSFRNGGLKLNSPACFGFRIFQDKFVYFALIPGGSEHVLTTDFADFRGWEGWRDWESRMLKRILNRRTQSERRGGLVLNRSNTEGTEGGGGQSRKLKLGNWEMDHGFLGWDLMAEGRGQRADISGQIAGLEH